ncbi:hypothetical protein CH373_05200 [Leptospira perolatii]|uniref:Long-chain-fatty-acyl-CoA reductase n=1 Tax=Leptospira perolatii TaxID=2023191 RepID=A0A2M9ZQG0_9LEPT|nr:acyl-CoA reductase [Leptospira perolatii]PJZ70470.1 hypothetical protein CH360_05620 [Leptospira perolatii]PJZ74306.1 hypothetical protein CH373_05200 [Leptospira perolatii]
MNNAISSNSTNKTSEYCKQNQLMELNENIIRIPSLVKGRLLLPNSISKNEIEEAFARKDSFRGVSDFDATYVKVGETHVLKEAIIDRQNMEKTGKYVYSLIGSFDPADLIESDIQSLVDGIYSLSFRDILDYFSALQAWFIENEEFVDTIRRTTLLTSELPDIWHNTSFSLIHSLLDHHQIELNVNSDLSAWSIPGSSFLDDWQDLPEAEPFPETANLFASEYCGDNDSAWSPSTPKLKAMPTRQLHITAGNSPHIPFFSAVRAIMTKSPAVIKSPYGATTPGALLSLAAFFACPDHPITKSLSIVYWPGGDKTVEDRFFAPNSFDRIVVWGAPDSVLSVKSRALFTKVLTFNPRYAVSFVGKDSLEGTTTGELNSIVVKLLGDALIANQKACIASQIIYTDGSDAQVERLAKGLHEALKEFDRNSPNYLKQGMAGDIKRLKRVINGDWKENYKSGKFQSAVVVMEDEFKISQHPMCRLFVIRKLKNPKDILTYLHHGVSTVSISPESLLPELRDSIAARGVSNVVPLGQSGRAYAGMSHDGMMVLSELVDWKNG